MFVSQLERVVFIITVTMLVVGKQNATLLLLLLKELSAHGRLMSFPEKKASTISALSLLCCVCCPGISRQPITTATTAVTAAAAAAQIPKRSSL